MFLSNNLHLKYANHKAFISDSGECLTYEDLYCFSERIKPFLKEKSLIFNLCENTQGSLLGYTAFISNGAVPLMLDAKIDTELLHGLLNTYEPNYVWLPDNVSPVFKSKKIVFSKFGYSLHLISSVKIPLNQDLALLLTTSGSTGSPKLVRLSYNNILSNAESIAEYLSIDSKERPVTALPMNYSFGLSIINSHILKGATILLTNKSLMEKEFWSFLKEEKATSLSGVPYTYEMLKRLRFFRMDLPYLKTLTQAGGKLNIELTKEFAEYAENNDKRFFVMYGQTEATARMSYLPYKEALSKAGSIGVAIPKGKFQLMDENRNEINGNDIVGELVYQGPNVSLGYAENKTDLNKGDENKGILYTGDLAKKDADGYYYIAGRKKRFIKLFGNRVNLDETERILKNLIPDCACVGNDDKMIIYIIEESRKEEVKQYISAKTGINYIAFEVRTIEAIPKNTSGKTIYSSLSI